MLENSPNTPDSLPDYEKQPYKFIKEISNVLMVGATTDALLVRFPCKTCGHFHSGKAGGPYTIKTIVDGGCMEEQCHCGKITPSEMLR